MKVWMVQEAHLSLPLVLPPITSPSHKLLASSNRPISNVSPLSGRKMERRESVDDLTKRFGGKARSPSPDVPIGKPSLPPKSTGQLE